MFLNTWNDRMIFAIAISLYKYFNAVSGAILAGPAALLDGMYHTRRMFGAGLPGAWPFAAVALHYIPGFVDRFRAAVSVSESFIDQITQHEAFAVDRLSSPTNLFLLRVVAADLPTFRARLQRSGVDMGSNRSDGSFLLAVNETWNWVTAVSLAERFVAAL